MVHLPLLFILDFFQRPQIEFPHTLLLTSPRDHDIRRGYLFEPVKPVAVRCASCLDPLLRRFTAGIFFEWFMQKVFDDSVADSDTVFFFSIEKSGLRINPEIADTGSLLVPLKYTTASEYLAIM